MYRCRSLLKKVSYASLFRYNYTLTKVFEAPAQRVALVEELPDHPRRSYTYGQLQRHVIAVADVLVERQQALHGSDSFLTWTQIPRDPKVRSIFSNECTTPSCDVLEDNGSYVATILTRPGYEFVVSLLALWAVSLLASPMSLSQHYKGELTYVLEHSGARTVIADAEELEEKFPPFYKPLIVRSAEECKKAKLQDVKGTFSVQSVMEIDTLLKEMRVASDAASTSGVLEVEVEGEEEGGKKACETAEDVEERLELLKSEKHQRSKAEAERYAKENFDACKRHSASQKDEPALEFESDNAKAELNPLFYQWFKDPSSQPTEYDDCLMIYTSGTTARPKGTVHSHRSITNQITSLQKSWRWENSDVILHMLPLHHVHGLVNILLCALASQACCVFTKFDNPSRIARRLEKGDITLFMAVPTVYTKLIASIHKDFSPIEKESFLASCSSHLRLMVSGSAALPVPTLTQFRELSGHTLLERYGMTEIGMALSQPLYPIEDRMPGTVGVPLPTVEAMVQPEPASDSTEEERKDESQYEAVGALAIASASLFDRYWKNPVATKKELRQDAKGNRYFDTGDTVGVRRSRHGPVYSILGRSSVDIIKHSGYKLSALEIEDALLARKDLFYEMAVVGVRHPVCGEQVVSIVSMQPAAAAERNISFGKKPFVETPELSAELRAVALELLAPYKCPSRFIVVPEVPRNATGKVNKKNLKVQLGLIEVPM